MRLKMLTSQMKGMRLWYDNQIICNAQHNPRDERAALIAAVNPVNVEQTCYRESGSVDRFE